MATRIVKQDDSNAEFIRRKALTAHNDGSLRTVVDVGELGSFVTDEPIPAGGGGTGPSPLQVLLGSLCGCESVTFNRTAAEMGFVYDSLDFEGSYTIDIRGRLGDRNVRPYFKTIRLRAVCATSESVEAFSAVVEETEARCPVMNLLIAADVNLEIEWVRDA